MRLPKVLPLALALLAPGGPEEAGRLDHPAIREASGIVKSRRHPGIFWVHNDSGNPPALFAVEADGSLVREFAVGALNVDWEDIAADGEGHLFVGDIGNNGGRLPIRAIYRLDEPDPARPAAKPIKPSLATFYKFPPGGRFDAESLFIDGKRAVVISKRLDGGEAELFAIPLDPPASAFLPALPKRIGPLAGFTEPATGAALSADGRRLAVCSYAVARVYERADGAPWERIGEVRYEADGIEAVCWDGADLLLAGEGRGLYRVRERLWRARE